MDSMKYRLSQMFGNAHPLHEAFGKRRLRAEALIDHSIITGTGRSTIVRPRNRCKGQWGQSEWGQSEWGQAFDPRTARQRWAVLVR
jgi:hypothetical protein